MISGNMIGSYSQLGKTFIITDADGNELTGVVVDQGTVFTATDNDVREGMVYASDNGVSTGTKNIPIYHTIEGYKVVSAGAEFNITNFMQYEYTKLLVVICSWNTSIANSIAAEKVVINGKVCNVGSADVLSDVTISAEDKSINLGITNDSDTFAIMRYITYKEEY